MSKVSKRKFVQRTVLDKRRFELANRLLLVAKVIAYFSAGVTVGLGAWFFRIPGGSGVGATLIVAGIAIALLAVKELRSRRGE